MTVTADAFISSSALRSLGFVKPYLVESLDQIRCEAWTIVPWIIGENSLVEPTAIYPYDEVHIGEQYYGALECSDIFISVCVNGEVLLFLAG